MKLKTLEEDVLKILTKYERTRSDDFDLIYAVYCTMNKDIKNMTFAEVMLHHKELGLPSFESITRCRRKICETQQDLINWNTAVVRAEEREKFEDYAKGE